MTIARTNEAALHAFAVALDDTRHPARFVVTVVAEDEKAARRALKLSRPYESVAWISDLGPEEWLYHAPEVRASLIADSFNAGHALGYADAGLENGS